MTVSPSDNVVEFNGVTSLDRQPTRVLAQAAGAKLDSCLVIGYDDDGSFYFSSSVADGADALWMIKVAEKHLLEAGT